MALHDRTRLLWCSRVSECNHMGERGDVLRRALEPRLLSSRKSHMLLLHDI
jgi:hypothetical protein